MLALRKTRTRREWDDDYAKRFKIGDIVQAWDKLPRAHGKKVAEIKITEIKKEDISFATTEDFEKEGFKFMEEKGLKIWDKDPANAFNEWVEAGGEYWVIDFIVLRTI